MKQYSKVKVLRFEGYGAEKKCQSAVNQGIDRGWQPIDMNSYISSNTNNLVVLAFMGKLKDIGEEKIGYQQIEGEPEKEEIDKANRDLREDRERPPAEREVSRGGTKQAPPSEGPVREEKNRSTKENDKSYEKCPRCGNVSLEIRDNHSAVCQYCGYLIDDIREESRSKQEEPDGKSTF